MSEELKPCPFCGWTKPVIEHIEGTYNVECPDCASAGPLEDSRAQAIAAWNRRADTDRIEALEAENARLREELRKAKQPHWFYFGDGCESDSCRDCIDECISEDFEWDNKPEGDHVLLISGARPVADMWVALHYYTEAEKDARDSDDEYTYTVHDSEEAARAALAESAPA